MIVGATSSRTFVTSMQTGILSLAVMSEYSIACCTNIQRIRKKGTDNGVMTTARLFDNRKVVLPLIAMVHTASTIGWRFALSKVRTLRRELKACSTTYAPYQHYHCKARLTASASRVEL